LGTLRDQIIYPLSREEAEVKALKMYGKGKLSWVQETRQGLKIPFSKSEVSYDTLYSKLVNPL